MASIAHEGNPRVTPDLVVSGTLDGDVFLLPLAGGGGVPQEAPAPPPSDLGYSVGANNPFKYTFTNFRFGTDGQNSGGSGDPPTFEVNGSDNAIEGSGTFIATSGQVSEYSKKDGILMYGMIRSPRIAQNLRLIDNNDASPGFNTVDHFNLDHAEIRELLNEPGASQPLGDRWGELPSNQAVNLVQLKAAAYVFVTAIGAPFSGVAVAVPPSATFDNFTGIVCAHNWGNATQYVMRYINQPLSGPGEILDATSTTNLAANESINLNVLLRRDAVQNIPDRNPTWEIRTNEATLTGLSESDIPYTGDDMRVALVNLPSTVDSGGDDLVIWQEISGVVQAQ